MAGKNPKDDRGREASKPAEIPKRGWKEILIRVKDEQSRDNLSMVAAGVAFYAFFAVFPALAAAVSIFGLAADPQQLQQQIDSMSGVMPQEAYSIVRDQLSELTSHPGSALSLGVIFGILLALWSANKGMKALMTALNIVYDEEETRGFFKLNAVSLFLTICGVLLGLTAIGFIIVVPAVINILNLPSMFEMLMNYLRWPLLGVILIIVLAALYRYCPDRNAPKWRWISWGSVTATVLWLIASILFSFYVSKFGDYSKMYGSMGAVIILLMWFYISSYVILLGGELNAEMEHQTRKDTTIGKPRPMGQRDAYVADTAPEPNPNMRIQNRPEDPGRPGSMT